MNKLIKRIRKFNKDRDWEQFHTSENLAKSISIEAAELLENYQWSSDANKSKIEDELADVFMYTLMLADKNKIDLIEISNKKIDRNEIRYSVEKSKGSSKKYTEL